MHSDGRAPTTTTHGGSGESGIAPTSEGGAGLYEERGWKGAEKGQGGQAPPCPLGFSRRFTGGSPLEWWVVGGWVGIYFLGGEGYY